MFYNYVTQCHDELKRVMMVAAHERERAREHQMMMIGDSDWKGDGIIICPKQ